MLCLFILLADGGKFQGLKRALDNQYLMDKDAYPTTMPQELKILEKYKSEVGATEHNAESAGESGVDFSQADAWKSNTTCYTCGERGHRVNDYPKLDDAQREKFWADRNVIYTACKARNGVAHAAVAEVAVAATPAPSPSVASAPNSDSVVDFECFQRYMDMLEATKNLNVGFIQLVKQ